MNLYIQNYSSVLKKNFMLIVMALVLLVVTFIIWAGVPFFIIGSLVAEATSNPIIIYFCISLSGGFLFSFYFVPVNLRVAKNIANIKSRGVISSFVQIQSIWGLVCSFIFALVLTIVLQLCVS